MAEEHTTELLAEFAAWEPPADAPPPSTPSDAEASASAEAQQYAQIAHLVALFDAQGIEGLQRELAEAGVPQNDLIGIVNNVVLLVVYRDGGADGVRQFLTDNNVPAEAHDSVVAQLAATLERLPQHDVPSAVTPPADGAASTGTESEQAQYLAQMAQLLAVFEDEGGEELQAQLIAADTPLEVAQGLVTQFTLLVMLRDEGADAVRAALAENSVPPADIDAILAQLRDLLERLPHSDPPQTAPASANTPETNDAPSPAAPPAPDTSTGAATESEDEQYLAQMAQLLALYEGQGSEATQAQLVASGTPHEAARGLVTQLMLLVMLRDEGAEAMRAFLTEYDMPPADIDSVLVQVGDLLGKLPQPIHVSAEDWARFVAAYHAEGAEAAQRLVLASGVPVEAVPAVMEQVAQSDPPGADA